MIVKYVVTPINLIMKFMMGK